MSLPNFEFLPLLDTLIDIFYVKKCVPGCRIMLYNLTFPFQICTDSKKVAHISRKKSCLMGYAYQTTVCLQMKTKISKNLTFVIYEHSLLKLSGNVYLTK